jgi:hypothetical protein
VDVVFWLFDIVVKEYDYLVDVVLGLFDIVVREYDYLVDVVFLLVDIVVQNMTIWQMLCLGYLIL